MKRALAVCTVLAVLGFSAFGIGTFSGKWEAKVNLLPSLGLATNKLTINYTDLGMTFTGILSLTGGTSDTFTAKVSGALGPFSLNGAMYFDFDAAAYMASSLSMSLDFAGLSISADIWHWMPSKYSVLDPYYTEYDDDPCLPQSPYEAGMLYMLKAKVDPFSIKVNFLDCCQGIEFDKLVVTVDDIGLCCGISLDAEFAFTKIDGFKYLEISGIEIPLCCGVSLTAGVKFTTSGKQVTTGLAFAGFGDACFTVYADALKEGNAWVGIDIYGWKIKCSLGDCSYFEVLTALNVDKVEEILDNPYLFLGDEFEYMKLGFCGAGCCGGQYSVGISVFFQESGSLFGITRIGAEMSIPVMDSLTVNVSFSTPDTLSVGWVFTF